jgi:hypothetical protein
VRAAWFAPAGVCFDLSDFCLRFIVSVPGAGRARLCLLLVLVFFHGGLFVMHIGIELHVGSILIVILIHVTLLASSVTFHCDSDYLTPF